MFHVWFSFLTIIHLPAARHNPFIVWILEILGKGDQTTLAKQFKKQHQGNDSKDGKLPELTFVEPLFLLMFLTRWYDCIYQQNYKLLTGNVYGSGMITWQHDCLMTFRLNQHIFLKAHNDHILTARQLMGLFCKIELLSTWQVLSRNMTSAGWLAYNFLQSCSQSWLEHDNMTNR